LGDPATGGRTMETAMARSIRADDDFDISRDLWPLVFLAGDDAVETASVCP
jgi:hypothetical protein